MCMGDFVSSSPTAALRPDARVTMLTPDSRAVDEVEKRVNSMFGQELTRIFQPDRASKGPAAYRQLSTCTGAEKSPGIPVFASFHKAGVYASGQLARLFNGSS